MSTKLYVGNLAYSTSQETLRAFFAPHGNVTEVNVMMDRISGRPRGFAFVTMDTQEAANEAIKALNGKNLDGRALKINEARPREERPPGGGGYESRGGYEGGRGGARDGGSRY